MKRIILFFVALCFGISYTFAQQVTINQKNGQKIIYNASDIESIYFANTNTDGSLPKILIGAIVLSSAPSDPTDIQTVLTDEVISDAIQKGKDSNGTMYLREKELDEVLYPKFVMDDAESYKLHYGIVMIPNIAEYSQYEGGFIDVLGRTFSNLSVVQVNNNTKVINGTSTITYNDVEYRVYAIYSTKMGGGTDWTIHAK